MTKRKKPMTVSIAVRLPDGTIEDREPTEEELQDIAERSKSAMT